MNIIIPYMIQIHKNNKTHKNDESSRASFFSKLYNNNNNAIFNKNFFRFTTVFVHTTALTIPTISFFLYCTYFLPHYFVFSRVHKTIPIILTNNSFLNTRAIFSAHDHAPHHFLIQPPLQFSPNILFSTSTI